VKHQESFFDPSCQESGADSDWSADKMDVLQNHCEDNQRNHGMKPNDVKQDPTQKAKVD
jgi:hypothetical protein